MSDKKSPKIDFKQAIENPASCFHRPQDVLDHPEFSREQKIEILRRWEYDARELSVAEEEGMGGGEPALLTLVLAALGTLTEGGSSGVPSKQGS